MTDRELLELALDAISGRYESELDKAEEALRERLSQPEPEPVFYVIQATDRFGEGYEQTYWGDPNGFPVYAAPPKREWVGLTDAERWEVTSKKWWDWEDSFDIEGFSRAIERVLKEKNHG